MRQHIERLPPEARLWVYTSENPISDEQSNALLGALDAFIEGWLSHGRPVLADALVHDSRFLVVAAYVDGDTVSGCGVDESVRVIEQIGADTGISWVDGLAVAYRDSSGDVRVLPRHEFGRLASQGSVHGGTPVFDLSIHRLDAWKRGLFEIPAGRSWHAGTFGLRET